MSVRAQAFAGILKADARNVYRDSFLVYAFALPVVMGLAGNLAIPPLTDALAARTSFDLTPYWPLITGYYMLLSVPVLMGTIVGFLLIDERDDHVLNAIQVTPVPLPAYLGYRVLLPGVLSIALSTLGWWLTGLSNLPPHAMALAACGAAPLAPATMLFLVGWAANKIQAFALLKIISALMLLPVAAYFVPTPWQYGVGLVFPPYWPMMTAWHWEAGQWALGFGGLALGLATNTAVAALLLRHYLRRAYR